MKSKTIRLKLKKEVIVNLSPIHVGGEKFTVDNCLTRYCEDEPFTTKLGYCADTFDTCVCATFDCTATSLGGGCPGKPQTQGCMLTDNCGSRVGVCMTSNEGDVCFIESVRTVCDCQI